MPAFATETVFSVIISTYNRADLLRLALEGVLSGNLRDYGERGHSDILRSL